MLTVRFGQLRVGGLSPLKIRSLAGCSQTPLRLGSQPWIKLKVQISHWHLINGAIKRTIEPIYGSYF
jgi:hypothetical protein